MFINGKTYSASALTYAQVKASSDILSQIEAKDCSVLKRAELSAALILVSHPELKIEDIEASSPGALIAAGLQIYRVTFTDPEDLALTQAKPGE